MFKKFINHIRSGHERRVAERAEKARQENLFKNSLANFYGEYPALLEQTKELEQPSLIRLIEKSIDNALDDNYLSEEEERRLSDFMDHYGIGKDAIDQKSLEKLVKGALLRDLFESNVNPRLSATNLPFKLMKKEILIWAFPDIDISEIVTVKGWEGRSQGISFRVMKGVYWRVGATKGKMVESQERKNLGHGVLAVTNYNLYVKAGLSLSMRISLDKIISVDADAENVIVFREGQRSKPMCFRTPDAWFLANLVQNAANWQ